MGAVSRRVSTLVEFQNLGNKLHKHAATTDRKYPCIVQDLTANLDGLIIDASQLEPVVDATLLLYAIKAQSSRCRLFRSYTENPAIKPLKAELLAALKKSATPYQLQPQDPVGDQRV